ncbi:MAG: hypothetical protein AAF213_13240, partial [Pseudomonadota bacterium]
MPQNRRSRFLDLSGLTRGLTTEDLSTPPPDDFAPVAERLRELIPALQDLTETKPGTAPNNLLEGSLWRLQQRRYSPKMVSALTAMTDLADAIERVDGMRYNDPDAETAAYDRLRAQITRDRRVIRRGIEAASSYHFLLLDDAPTSHSIAAKHGKLTRAMDRVMNERFNFKVLKDWLDRGELPDRQA